MILSEALRQGEAALACVSTTSRLDAEVLMAHVLQVDRSYLYAHGERVLAPAELSKWTEWLKRRSEGEPVAYLVGHQAFWGLDFMVTPDVLVPRPETELLVEQALACFDHAHRKVADVGTGSGAIACALASERPAWAIEAVDISEAALTVANTNAERMQLQHVVFRQGDLLADAPSAHFDMVVSNPPYIDPKDPCLEGAGVCKEPRLALIAEDHGMSLLTTIIAQAMRCLKKGGVLLLEHGATQGSQVRMAMAQAGYHDVETAKDLASHGRVTIGRS